MAKKTIKDVEQDLCLHLRDYKEIRKDVDSISSWASWLIKLIVGAVIVSVLALIGLK
jgi:hypothetical protein